MTIEGRKTRILFQSTLPVGGATVIDYPLAWRRPISIHAPRGGSDGATPNIQIGTVISIHAPRGGSDLPAHGQRRSYTNFNPRSPWGERLFCRK